MEASFLNRTKLNRPVIEPSYNTEDFDSKGVDCPNLIKKRRQIFDVLYRLGWSEKSNWSSREYGFNKLGEKRIGSGCRR